MQNCNACRFTHPTHAHMWCLDVEISSHFPSGFSIPTSTTSSFQLQALLQSSCHTSRAALFLKFKARFRFFADTELGTVTCFQMAEEVCWQTFKCSDKNHYFCGERFCLFVLKREPSAPSSSENGHRWKNTCLGVQQSLECLVSAQNLTSVADSAGRFEWPPDIRFYYFLKSFPQMTLESSILCIGQLVTKVNVWNLRKTMRVQRFYWFTIHFLWDFGTY